MLGGRFCKGVVVVEIYEDGINRSLDSPYSESARVFEIDSMPEPFETLHPLIFYKEENRICIMKSQEGSAPQVLYYSFQNFLQYK